MNAGRNRTARADESQLTAADVDQVLDAAAAGDPRGDVVPLALRRGRFSGMRPRDLLRARYELAARLAAELAALVGPSW